MLTQVDIITAQGNVLELPLGDVSSGYLVQEIEGLDPVKANLVSSSFANSDGEYFYSSRRETRNIVFHLELVPNASNGTGRQLRKNLYTYAMPKSEIRMRFYEEDLGGYVDIIGIVEDLKCPPFGETLEASISVMCYDSDFFEPEDITITGWTTEGDEEVEIDYTGSIETGFHFVMLVDHDLLSEFTIYHRAPDNTFSVIDFLEPLTNGQSLDISTINGAKGATVFDPISGGTSSLLRGVDGQSNWIQLFPGKNRIRVDAEGTPIQYFITYKNKHGGL